MKKYQIYNMTKKQLIILGNLSELITELENDIMKACCAQREYETKEIREKINLTQHIKRQVEEMGRGFKKKKNITLGTYIKAWEELIINKNQNYTGLLKRIKEILI